MPALATLWLPILLSSVFAFFVSFILHTALPWHAPDYKKVPNEDKVSDTLRPHAIPPGDYMLPRCDSMAEMKSPGFKEKMNRGPVVVMTVMPPGIMPMGKCLTQWFAYLLAVSFFAAYLSSHTVPIAAHYLQVFRVVGATAFLAYSGALCQLSIWYRRSWGTTIRSSIDGLIYACVTAGTFGWLWPR